MKVNRIPPIAAAILTATTVLAAPPKTPDRRTSEGFAFATYREQSGSLTVLLDAYPATLHENDAYIPLPIAIGLRGKGEPVTLTTESFTLVDARGNAEAAASYEQLSAQYPKRSFDESLFRQRPIVLGSLFSNSREVHSSFYPAPGRGTRSDRVELAAFTWFDDVVYFPKPKAGLDGVLTLKIHGQGMEKPIEVVFEVPHSHAAGSGTTGTAD